STSLITHGTGPSPPPSPSSAPSPPPSAWPSAAASPAIHRWRFSAAKADSPAAKNFKHQTPNFRETPNSKLQFLPAVTFPKLKSSPLPFINALKCRRPPHPRSAFFWSLKFDVSLIFEF